MLKVYLTDGALIQMRSNKPSPRPGRAPVLRLNAFAADLRDRDLELTSGFNLELFDCIFLVGGNDCSEALYFLADEIDRPRLALVGRYRAAPLTYFLFGTSHSGHRLLHE
jgi:hypothetical protein